MRRTPKKVVVRDKMQNGYTYYLTEPAGKNFHEEFKPHLTPKEMLELGVFCGKYMRDTTKEFPKSWFTRAKFAEGSHEECSINYCGVKASQPLSEWKRKGWIHKDDPRGWFQWYCRYYMGRRMEDDERQIKRWKAFGRHAAQVRKHCRKGDMNCRKVQRQALLHWAYDARSI